jgi:hypothetical protein
VKNSIIVSDYSTKQLKKLLNNTHKTSDDTIRQKGLTSSLIFYSHPLKSAPEFIETLVKLMYEKKHTEGIQEETVHTLSSVIMNALIDVQKYRKENCKEFGGAVPLFRKNLYLVVHKN